jgi:hypothetical protein
MMTKTTESFQQQINILAHAQRELVTNTSCETKSLPASFVPGESDVICARGKQAKNHSGNVRFRAVVNDHLEVYSKAATRMEKSLIVSSIIDAVRNATPSGGFVREEGDGSWYEVGDHIAREKIGQR